MTSLEVIKEVMNVPMAAVHAIARMNGISTADDHAKIISEEELLPFVEAFERKTRNYFVNSMRNYAQLNLEELQTFTEFCKTFKKGNVSLAKVSNWSHIGKTKLRQYFVDQIKEKTPSDHLYLDLLNRLLMDVDVLSERTIPESIVEPLFTIDSELFNIEYHWQHPKDLISRINSSWCYHAKITFEGKHIPDVLDIIRQVVLSARYYIYVDDEEDHLFDTVTVNGHYDLFINSTNRMAV